MFCMAKQDDVYYSSYTQPEDGAKRTYVLYAQPEQAQWAMGRVVGFLQSGGQGCL